MPCTGLLWLWSAGATLSLPGMRSSLRRPLTAQHRLSGFSSWGMCAEVVHGMRSLPGPGTEPVSSALSEDSQPLDHQENPIKFPFKTMKISYN